MKHLFAALALAAAALCSAPAQAQTSPDTPKTAWDYLVADQVVMHGEAGNHVRIFAAPSTAPDAPAIVILPSLGRGVEDYTEDYGSTLTTRFAQAGYRVILVQPRGIGRSPGDLTPNAMSMSLFAHDLKRSLEALGVTRVNLIGHAFGNRLARTYATLFPEAVDHLALMASGGGGLDEAQNKCLLGSFNSRLPEPGRLEALRCAFFAEGSDPRLWLDGWHPKLARAQYEAARMINGEFFAAAGGKPFLLIQASEDFIAPPDKAGRPLKARLGDQVAYAEIPFASHALSSEQPEIIAALVLEYLRRN